MFSMLEDIKNRLKMENDEFQEYAKEINHVENILNEEGIRFQDDFKLVFFSHMISLAKRFKEDISLNCGDDIPEDEVDTNSIRISERIIYPINQRYSNTLDRLEVILAAIQIQLALDMQNEVMN